MFTLRFITVLLLFLLISCSSDSIFNEFPNFQGSTPRHLSDKELSLQFTLSYLTFLQENEWPDEYLISDNPYQLSFSAVRYQLAFSGYAAASLCYKTPAYREICISQMKNMIDRMIDKISWQYVDYIWGPGMAEVSCQFKYGGCIFPNKANWTNTSNWYVSFMCDITFLCVFSCFIVSSNTYILHRI